MIESLRTRFNEAFTEEKYQNLLADVNGAFGFEVSFKIAETPVFLDQHLKNELQNAAADIIRQIESPVYHKYSERAVPSAFRVGGNEGEPMFMAIDFAICKQNGVLIPQLIEMQGFPSLYAFQHFISGMYRKHFGIIPDNYTHFFPEHLQQNENSYSQLLQEIMVGGEDPEQVILMEIEPERQKTKIDFYCTQEFTGMQIVCITKVKQEGKKLYYEKDGKRIPIKRIYNRAIFDELASMNVALNFNFQEDLDVEWLGHPNWFFKISKYTLPYLESKYSPKAYFLHELMDIPDDLENYVLKPLFSFAGAGVKFDVTRADIEAVPSTERKNYILMKKVAYEPIIKTPDMDAKMEVRLLFARHNGQMKLLTNLIRLSKGKMMGVDFNKGLSWVGGTVAFFEH